MLPYRRPALPGGSQLSAARRRLGLQEAGPVAELQCEAVCPAPAAPRLLQSQPATGRQAAVQGRGEVGRGSRGRERGQGAGGGEQAGGGSRGREEGGEQAGGRSGEEEGRGAGEGRKWGEAGAARGCGRGRRKCGPGGARRGGGKAGGAGRGWWGRWKPASPPQTALFHLLLLRMTDPRTGSSTARPGARPKRRNI